MTVLRYVGWILALVFLIAAATYIWNTQKEAASIQPTSVAAEEPLVLSQPVMKEFENEWLKLNLTAESALIFEQKKITRLRLISAQVYKNKETIPDTYITSDYGEMDSQVGLLHLWGSVEINMSDGQRLRTNELFLDHVKNIVYNNVSVTAFTEQDEIVAGSMRYDFTQGLLVLNKPKVRIEL